MKVQTKKIFEELNSAQKEAVNHIDGPSLIVAGAGSGKTRVLTCRIANILAHGHNPSRVLALTFTRKAAGEMKERIASMVGDRSARRIWMGTFHSIFIRFLREYAEQLEYPREFTIYDRSDSRNAIKQCIKELQLDDKVYKPAQIQSRISLAKNNLITVSGYYADASLMEADAAARRGRIADIYALYVRKCKTAGAMDFDDILLNTNILLKNFPEALETISAKFDYILVDEYQDTNHAQYIILKKLAAPHRNICVVGDDSQSIYGFRGARIENILQFKKDYPDAAEYKLEQNYRSTKTIVNAANSVIGNNSNRLNKECFSEGDEGEKIGVIKAFTEQEEAYLTASSIIERIFTDKAQYGDFAILYRTNAQSRALEEALRKRNLPYRIYSGQSFFDRAEVKDLMAYFRLTVNPRDDEAFRRIINVPARGIGNTSLSRLTEAATEAGSSLYEAIFLPPEKLLEAGLKPAAVNKFQNFAALIEPIHQECNSFDAFTIAQRIGNDSGYLASLKNDNSPEGISRFENIEELFNSIKSFVEEEMERRIAESDLPVEEIIITLSEYIENISLLSEIDREDETEDEAEVTNKITLMTVHSSKGLEFPYVYIAGMEENLFPSVGLNSETDIEEERRLFYVALTRAQKCATISFARNRMRWGKQESNPVSRFVKEIHNCFLEKPVDDVARIPYGREGFTTTSGRGSIRRESKQDAPDALRRYQLTKSFSGGAKHTPSAGFQASAIYDLKVGQRVEHATFGFGTIISFDGDDANAKAIVRFDNSGEKTLLLKFAKLRIV
ncbi:MAG: UvrD-helicase domain-containing protein [Bacteroidales bacterium]|nr:UvrD-helicase domain-containing protein [Bacteroidales bacterium]